MGNGSPVPERSNPSEDPAAGPSVALLPIALLFFLSGMSGLVYEIIWSRHLQQLFGVSSFAITTVVAAYMAGLALGGGLLGRVADRLSAAGAVAGYGALELVIGAFAFLFTPLLAGVARVYAGLAAGLLDSLSLRIAVDFLLSFALLLVPTTLMGGTLPLISRCFAASAGRTGRGFGWAYALNTAGAVLGSFLAGFLLLHTLGLRASLRLFGTGNLLLGAMAILLAGKGRLRSFLLALRFRQLFQDSETRSSPAGSRTRTLLFLAALSGCVSLGSEIIWIRGFASLFLSTTYTFSLVLMVFLVGIACGSALAARIRPGPATIAKLMVLLSASTLTQLALYETAHQAVFESAVATQSYTALLMVQAAIICVIVLPLTLCSGAALTVIVGLSSRGLGRAGRDVGRVYIANTVGALSGTLLAGFALLPALGSVAGSRVMAGLALGGALLAGVLGRRTRWAPLAVLVGLAACLLPGPSLSRLALSPVWMAKQVVKARQAGETFTQEDLRLRRRLVGLPLQVLSYSHGLAADTAIAMDQDSSSPVLFINGMPNASALADQSTQLGLAVLPYLYASSLESCLHIGLGSGITAGVWATLPGTGRTRVVELEGSLFESTRGFEPFSFGLHDNPSVEFVSDDALAHLSLVPDGSYEVIASEPSQIWSKGIGNLFSSEFFQSVRRKLVPDGIFVTWLMAYDVPAPVWAIAVGTLLDEFEQVHAFVSPDIPGDVIFLCTRRALEFHQERWDRLLALRGIRASIPRALDLEEPADLVRFMLAGDPGLRAEVARTLAAAGLREARNTLDLPLLEHLYPETLLSGASNELLRRLHRSRVRAEVRGPQGKFLMPPGLEGRIPRPSTLMALCESFQLPPLPLVGLADLPAALARRQLGEQQRIWTYIAAVASANWKAARSLWPGVRGMLAGHPYLQAWALTHVQHQGDRKLGAQLLRSLGEPDFATPLELLELHVEQRLRATGGSKEAISAHVDLFLAAMPEERFLREKIGSQMLQTLAIAAGKSGRSAEVEAYLEGVDRIFGGRQFYVRLALCQIAIQQGRLDRAREILVRYAGWTLTDAWLTVLRERLKD
ncbi:MAG: fused MFS/spermidine synthase [Planctomycetota bacterium]